MVNGKASFARLFTFSIFHFPFAILVLSGCHLPQHTGPTTQPYVGPTQSMSEVIAAINENNHKLPTLWAHANSIDVSIVSEKGKRHDEVLSGNVLYRAPSDVSLVGDKDILGQVVQIGSNRDIYWLSIKKVDPDTAWWGRYKYLGSDCAKPIPVRPDLVLQVLGVSTINMDFTALPAPVMRFNNDRDEYMLTWVAPAPARDRWVAVREIWYDRQTKRPTHVMLYDLDGRVQLSGWLARHKPVEVADLPKDKWPTVATDYRLYFPETGSKLHLSLDDVRLSRKGAPNDKSFGFTPTPKGAGVSKVIQLDEDCGP